MLNFESSITLQVSTDDFGLDTNDILALNDKELNQVVGLRRLAPYREEHKSKKRDRHAQMQLKMITKPAHKVTSLICRSLKIFKWNSDLHNHVLNCTGLFPQKAYSCVFVLSTIMSQTK